jgi:hypothetical protein
MASSAEIRVQNLTLTLPAQIVKEAEALFPNSDLSALALMLLEKYVRYQKRKLLAQQYQQYYQALTNADQTEEKQILAEFAALENEVNAFIEAEEEVNGGS